MSVLRISNREWPSPWDRLIKSRRIHRPAEKPVLNTIAELMWPENIRLDLDVSSKPQLFEEVGRLMEREHALPQAWVASSLAHREKIGSTALGEGVAIPHARVKDLERIQVAYVRLKSPIPFEAPDGKPVSDVLVLLVPKQATEEHLSILAEATQMFSDRQFRERLHRSTQAQEVRQLFQNWKLAS